MDRLSAGRSCIDLSASKGVPGSCCSVCHQCCLTPKANLRFISSALVSGPYGCSIWPYCVHMLVTQALTWCMQDELGSGDQAGLLHSLADVLPQPKTTSTSTSVTVLLSCLLLHLLTTCTFPDIKASSSSQANEPALVRSDPMANRQISVCKKAAGEEEQVCRSQTSESMMLERRCKTAGQEGTSWSWTQPACLFLVEKLLSPLAGMGAQEKLHCKDAAMALQQHLLAHNAAIPNQLKQCCEDLNKPSA